MSCASAALICQRVHKRGAGCGKQVAGTEQGVTEPEATFSACFGGAFLMWHPMKVRFRLRGGVLHDSKRGYVTGMATPSFQVFTKGLVKAIP